MAVRSNHVTTRSAQYSLGAGADLPIARIVVLLLLALPIAALIVASHMAKAAPSEGAIELANFNPKALFADTTPHFLPKPVAALEPDADAGPPAPAEAEQAPSDTAEQVKVANTGGVGAILRADPPRGRQVTGLRDGTVLTVLEHQDMGDGTEWLRVKTPDGVEGWIFSRLVGPAQ